MKTAVLISGQMRTFGECLTTLERCVFRHLPDATYFISCAEDETAGEAYLLEGKHDVHIERVAQPMLTIPGRTVPASTNMQDSQRDRISLAAPYHISAPHQSILRQFWHLNRVWDFAHEKMLDGTDSVPFDCYIRCRPDLFFHETRSLPATIEPNQVFAPWWGGAGGINDRFAIMGRLAAQHYFGAWGKLQQMLAAGLPLHPETLLLESLTLGGCDVRRTLHAVFSTYRPDGSKIAPTEYHGEFMALLAATR
jgi:hypothetical protein